MRRLPIFAAVSSCCAVASLSAAQPQTFAPTYTIPRGPAVADSAQPATPVGSRKNANSYAGTANNTPFVYRDPSGKVISAPVINGPVGKIDARLSPTLIRAASIAQERSYAHSKSRCWHYVKEALLAAGAVDSRPKTALAKQAADELVQVYGFKRLPIRDPYAAPVGAVLVYGARRAAGHVEIRTKTGFVSDFRSPKPSKRPLIGVYVKA